MIDNKFIEYIRDHQVVSLACITPDGKPHAAAVFYAADDECNLYFLSDRKTVHASSFLKDKAISATIQKDIQAWQNLRGVQISGECVKPDGNELKTAKKLYADRYPFIKNPVASIKKAIGQCDFWVIKPTWMRLIDNTVSFGHKIEWKRD